MKEKTMRKAIYILSLAAIAMAALANGAAAQHRGGGHGGGGGGHGGWSDGHSGDWHGHDHGGTSVWIAPAFGFGYYGGWGRGYYSSPYYYGYDYGPSYYYSSPDYYSSPNYYYSDSVTQVPPIDYRQSSYADPNSASITVVVPNPNAEVWFDDAPTQQRGMQRVFTTPALQKSGTYTIRARWTENGRPMDQTRQVRVQPGQSATVNFQAPASEELPAPKSK
jgi:uncharacterized protein (TIGR03000 family)